MKYTHLLTFLLLCFLHASGQNIPSDSLILSKIYGSADPLGKTYSRELEEDEKAFARFDKVVYRVVYKQELELEEQRIILVIIEAPNFGQHGHQLGYLEFYFLKEKEGGLEIVASILSDGEVPIGDDGGFKILDIGPDKKALISIFESTGNQHYEKTSGISLLSLGELRHLLTINSEYDNSLWKIPDSEDEPCEARSFEEQYEVMENESEWYDIRVHRTEYGFTEGCEERFLKSESEKVYSYIDGEYRVRED